MTDTREGTAEEYYLVASCKAEDTYGNGVLFKEPNYDFSGIFSDKEHHIMRVGVPYENRDTVEANEERFEDVLIDITMSEADILPTNEEVVEATLANKVINGRTEITDPNERYRAMIEFPVKTMNVNDIRTMYQVDTGPILLPDFGMKVERMVERFQLAFVAYNRPDEAYFIIQEPVPVVPSQPGKAMVAHYSRIVRMRAENSVIALR